MDFRQTLHAIPPHHPASSSRNPLISKDDVGRGKPATRPLPSADHRYGAPVNPDKEGVRDLIHNWKSHQSYSFRQDPTQDFKKLNKISVKVGISDSRDQTTLRNARKDITVKQRVGQQIAAPSYDRDPNFTYGGQRREKVVMGEILAHEYGRQGQERTANTYEAYASAARAADIPIRFRGTKASRGQSLRTVHRIALRGFNAQRGSVDPTAQPFKMSKFLTVAPRTDTFIVNELYESIHPDRYQEPRVYHERMEMLTTGQGKTSNVRVKAANLKREAYPQHQQYEQYHEPNNQAPNYPAEAVGFNEDELC